MKLDIGKQRPLLLILIATVSYWFHSLRKMSLLIQHSKKNVIMNKLKNLEHKNTKKRELMISHITQ